ncbi:histidine kinase [Thioalkalivibrio denitrificans]|uniref:Histidine kinase n=1 Tax=Thioalkalivibrio denitrificans TaxID=108003 RepID=A0A1V3N9D0_9GAMM|nr:CBS domain-containing protein [Thioalkalivibrio denitrificans]OOG21488.1 histidine kinase [Thioalkalivibrio denitrificans]
MVSGSVPVDEFTTPDPITANEDMTIDDLRNLMEKHGIRHLPVVRGDRVVGVISDRNVRIVSGLPIAEKHQVRAADIMAADPLTVIATTPLDEVAYAMSENKVGSVIVNDEDGRFLGIFTASDALNALVEIVRGGDTPAA